LGYLKKTFPLFLLDSLIKLNSLPPEFVLSPPPPTHVISQLMPMHNTIPSALTFAIQGAALYYSEMLDTSPIFSWQVVYYKNLTA